MDVRIGDDKIGEMIGAAVMSQITQESRDLLIQNAIKYLLTPEKSNIYGSKEESPLQKAFNTQLNVYAREYIKQQIENDEEFSGKIKSVVQDAMMKSFGDTAARGKVVDKLAGAIESAFNSY